LAAETPGHPGRAFVAHKSQVRRILKFNCMNCHRELVADLVAHGAFADDSNNCIRCHLAVVNDGRQPLAV
jgi:hypothetical protein